MGKLLFLTGISLFLGGSFSLLSNDVKSLRGRISNPSSFLLTLDKLKEEMSKDERITEVLVAHRGLHYATDDTIRPLENTLPAYERVWAAGAHFAECDVFMTKDGELVLSHDPSLKRLALHPGSVTKDVEDSTFAEVELLALKDGSRAPRLTEVLTAAKRVDKNAKLIIEIKSENLNAARKLATVAMTELGERIAVVMSYSKTVIEEFARKNPRKNKIASMLLTVKSVNEGKQYTVFNLDASVELEDWLKESTVEGLFVEFDPVFTSSAQFSDLCKRVPVGVWGVARDGATTLLQLAKQGAKFVNSDLVDEFFHE
jgi:glycerophosphoryl diester phosphodiesterase